MQPRHSFERHSSRQPLFRPLLSYHRLIVEKCSLALLSALYLLHARHAVRASVIPSRPRLPAPLSSHSTSISYKVAKSFLRGGQGTIFHITGATGRRISHLSFFSNEEEVLFPPNTVFRVKRLCHAHMRALLREDRTELSVEQARKAPLLIIEMEEVQKVR